jgi:adenine-specific DNA-methyltransferase
VQISDENLHHVREVLDSVFGDSNFVSVITFSKTSSATSELIPSTSDYLVWYAKDKQRIKYNRAFVPKIFGEKGDSAYSKVEMPDGSRRSLSKEEKKDVDLLPNGAKIYRIDNLTSQRPPGDFPVEFDGNTYRPRRGYWKTGESGFEKLKQASRIESTGNAIYYVRYLSDFPVYSLTNRWDDTGVAGFASDKLYVVQTNQKVIQRCLLMTTDPGDLVLDPTCGSGTTAYVAEQWGRRWITCDTSRVPLALARQRLLTATFPWYELKEPKAGPAGGFVYRRKQNRKGEEVGGLVPRITLKSIANDEEPETVTLVDRPEQNKQVTRVCGPFSVEATVQAAGSMLEEQDGVKETAAAYENPRAYLDRMIEVLRQSKTLRLPKNKALELAQVRPLATEDYEHLHAEAVEQNGQDRRIAVMFGPQDGAIGSATVLEAAREAWYSKFDALYLFGFAIQAKNTRRCASRAESAPTLW